MRGQLLCTDSGIPILRQEDCTVWLGKIQCCLVICAVPSDVDALQGLCSALLGSPPLLSIATTM